MVTRDIPHFDFTFLCFCISASRNVESSRECHFFSFSYESRMTFISLSYSGALFLHRVALHCIASKSESLFFSSTGLLWGTAHGLLWGLCMVSYGDCAQSFSSSPHLLIAVVSIDGGGGVQAGCQRVRDMLRIADGRSEERMYTTGSVLV